MKLLVDACLSPLTAEALSSAGHDVTFVGHWKGAASDENILAVAAEEARAVITLDRDFGELIVRRGAAHAGLLRLVDFAYSQQAGICCQLVRRFEQELSAGALIVASPRRVRVRVLKTAS